MPFKALSADTGDAVTVASYGFAGVPGFGLASAYADLDFSLVIEDPETDEPAGCGDILEADRGRVRGGRSGARADQSDR